MSAERASGPAPTPGSAPAEPAPRTPAWRHVVNGAALVVILIVAGIVAHTAPDEATWQAPIPVAGLVGAAVEGRNIAATVHGVQASRTVQAESGWSGETTGVWIVVDASVEAVVDERAALLGGARLRIGDTTFSASQRAEFSSIAGTSLAVGIPIRGSLLFEVPESLVTGPDAARAELLLAISEDPRVDSQLVVPLDLTSIDLDETIRMDDPVRGAA